MLLPIREGYELSYTEIGQGVPLVFLPGILGDRTTFSLITQSLTDRFRCVCVEFAGQGNTVIDGLTDPSDFTFEQHANSVVALLDHLDLRDAHVVGLSFGSVVAQYLAANHPEYVSDLILLGALVNNQAFHYRNWNTLWGQLTDDVERFTRVSLGLCYSEGFWAANPDMLEPSYGKIQSLSDHQLQAFKWHLQHGREYPIPDMFLRIAKPMFFIHGDKDLIHPLDDMRSLIEEHPDVQLQVLAGKGHGLHLEAPDEIAEAIRVRYA